MTRNRLFRSLWILVLAFLCTAGSSAQLSFVPRAQPLSEDDPWASAFACYCFKESNIECPPQRTFEGWKNWGIPIDRPLYGCVAVFDLGDSSFHVGFVTGTYRGMLVVLGGNQNNSVCKLAFQRSRAVAYRLPPKFETKPGDEILPTVVPNGASERLVLDLSRDTSQRPSKHQGRTYRAASSAQQLTIKSMKNGIVQFELLTTSDCGQKISGSAYELYTSESEIDAEHGIAYGCREYYYWDTADGSRGFTIRLSRTGTERARVQAWGYDKDCTIADSIMR